MLTDTQNELLFRVENSMPEPGDLAAVVDLVRELENAVKLLTALIENVVKPPKPLMEGLDEKTLDNLEDDMYGSGRYAV